MTTLRKSALAALVLLAPALAIAPALAQSTAPVKKPHHSSSHVSHASHKTSKPTKGSATPTG